MSIIVILDFKSNFIKHYFLWHLLIENNYYIILSNNTPITFLEQLLSKFRKSNQYRIGQDTDSEIY